MSILNRIEKPTKASVQQRSHDSMKNAEEQLDAHMEKGVMAKLAPKRQELVQRKRSLINFLNDTYLTNFSKLFEQFYFYPFPGLTESERFNASVRGATLASFIALYWIYVFKGPKLLLPQWSLRNFGMIDRRGFLIYGSLLTVIAFIPAVLSVIFQSHYKRRIERVSEEIGEIPRILERTKEQVKVDLEKKHIEQQDLISNNYDVFHENKNTRRPMRQEYNPASTHLGASVI